MITSKVTSKGQVTIPKQVRDLLQIGPGDVLAYEVQEGTVRLRKLKGFDAAWHEAVTSTLEEWDSPEDNEAFRDL